MRVQTFPLLFFILVDNVPFMAAKYAQTTTWDSEVRPIDDPVGRKTSHFLAIRWH